MYSNELVENQRGVFRLAIRRQSHQFVFAAIDLEAAVVGEGRIEQPQRVGKTHLLSELDLITSANAPSGGGPFADAVDRQNRGLVIRRWKEGAGCVRQMMRA